MYSFHPKMFRFCEHWKGNFLGFLHIHIGLWKGKFRKKVIDWCIIIVKRKKKGLIDGLFGAERLNECTKKILAFPSVHLIYYQSFMKFFPIVINVLNIVLLYIFFHSIFQFFIQSVARSMKFISHAWVASMFDLPKIVYLS